jgi:hypothetical protein
VKLPPPIIPDLHQTSTWILDFDCFYAVSRWPRAERDDDDDDDRCTSAFSTVFSQEASSPFKHQVILNLDLLDSICYSILTLFVNLNRQIEKGRENPSASPRVSITTP